MNPLAKSRLEAALMAAREALKLRKELYNDKSTYDPENKIVYQIDVLETTIKALEFLIAPEVTQVMLSAYIDKPHMQLVSEGIFKAMINQLTSKE